MKKKKKNYNDKEGINISFKSINKIEIDKNQSLILIKKIRKP